MYFLKILISLSGAVMLATLPGFFDISYGVGGLTIRAAGGAAAFVFIYTQSPNIPNFNTPKAAPYSTAPYSTAPATARPGTTSSNHRYDSDATPLLVALSIDPLGMSSTPSSARSRLTLGGEPAGASGQDATGGGDAIPLSGGGADVGVATKASSTFVDAVGTMAWQVASSALQLLDRLKAALYAAAGWTEAAAAGVIDQFRALSAMPTSEIQAFVASTTDAATDLLNIAAAPAMGAVDQLGTDLGDLAVAAGLNLPAQDMPGILHAKVDHTVDTMGDLVSGVLNSPKDTLTGKAVNAVTEGLAEAAKDAMAGAQDLTQHVNAQLSALTDTLNDVAPALVAPISPTLGKLDAVAGRLPEAGGDITSALPPLTAALDGVDNVKLPGLPLPAGRTIESRAEEVRGGCGACLLPPLDLGGHDQAGLRDGLGGIGMARGGDGQGGGSAGSGSVSGGAGLAGGGFDRGLAGSAGAGGGAGPVSSALGGVGSAVGGIGSTVDGGAKGLLGRRR